MKPLLFFCLAVVFMTSCKKEIIENPMSLTILQSVKAALKDSISPSDYQSLDFNRALFSKAEQQQLYFLRIPFKGKKISEHFVIVKTDKEGWIEAGRTVQLTLEPVTPNGTIVVYSLNRKTVVHSVIENGYIAAFHPERLLRTYIEPSIPDVIVVWDIYIQAEYANYFSLNSFFNVNQTYSANSSYYGTMGDNFGDYSYYDEPNYSLGNLYPPAGEELIEFEPEYIYSLPSVNIIKLFNCFNYVPSPGASYSVKLCTDVPANSNPEASSTSSAISAGHTFLIVTKRNGTSEVTQSFGFYPKEQSYLAFGSVTSDIKDNGNNELNASIEMNISEDQFMTIKNQAISNASKSYNLSEYNCANFAVDIFNAVRENPLIIDPYTVYLPSNTNLWGISSEPNRVTVQKSPQTVFRKLQEMKNSGSLESANITIDQTHNSKAPISKGECN